MLGTRGALRRHAAVGTRALLVNAAHRVLRPGAFAGLHLAEAVAVRVWLARDSVQEIIGIARCAVRIAFPLTSCTCGTRAMFAHAFLRVSAFCIGIIGGRSDLDLPEFVTVRVGLAESSVQIEFADTSSTFPIALLGTLQPGGRKSCWTGTKLVIATDRISESSSL